MKHPILLSAITVAVLSSCSSAYRTGQTPDDVYFSPARPQDEYVRTEEKDDQQYRYDDQYYDDRYLHMKVHNHVQWDYLDDWYMYDRYSYRYNYYWGSYYNPYTSWNYYYNPYCRNYAIAYYPKVSIAQNYVVPRQFNLNTYTNNNYNNRNSNLNFSKINPGITKPVYNNSNNSNGFGNTIRQIFTNLGGSNNSSNSSGRSYSPSSSGGSVGGSTGGGSTGSGGGGVSRPSRGGN